MDSNTVNNIQIELRVRGKFGRVIKDDLREAVGASNGQHLVNEIKRLMEIDPNFAKIYSPQFRSWTVSVGVCEQLIRHLFGKDCKIELKK